MGVVSIVTSIVSRVRAMGTGLLDVAVVGAAGLAKTGVIGALSVVIAKALNIALVIARVVMVSLLGTVNMLGARSVIIMRSAVDRNLTALNRVYRHFQGYC